MGIAVFGSPPRPSWNVSNASFGVAGAGAVIGIIGLAISDWGGDADARLVVDPKGIRFTGRF